MGAGLAIKALALTVMKFATETETFIRVLEMLGGELSLAKGADSPLQLSACHERVSVRINGTVASVEALVWEEGQSLLSYHSLLSLLRQLRDEPNVLVQADFGGLRIQNHVLPVREFSGYTRLPDRFQIYLATDVGMVPSCIA